MHTRHEWYAVAGGAPRGMSVTVPTRTPPHRTHNCMPVTVTGTGREYGGGGGATVTVTGTCREYGAAACDEVIGMSLIVP